ncbi:hypothetical protein [Streptomyces sp. ODS28]|uniref:hypothetical protein n=1 Tax=Streptomyces sp. ODS28 TaxID=3136688 RepID=UPI0031F099CF
MRRVVLAGVTVLLMAGLTACGSQQGAAEGKGDGGGAQVQQADMVTGLRDGVRHQRRKTVRATRPHLVKKCKLATKRVKHTKRSGGKRKKTRTWYTTKHVNTCHKVRSGTETYRRVVRPQRWCVRLDHVKNVPGSAHKAYTGTDKNDVWFRVSRETYSAAREKPDHARLKFSPLGRGC